MWFLGGDVHLDCFEIFKIIIKLLLGSFTYDVQHLRGCDGSMASCIPIIPSLACLKGKKIVDRILVLSAPI